MRGCVGVEYRTIRDDVQVCRCQGVWMWVGRKENMEGQENFCDSTLYTVCINYDNID